ncbi:hypothetical protein B0J18DRAFT_270763 [Chaetomium sp. MPI-SDFR-AT-0129]|nr:hypothetical protein B0J18DRAFT_270763 [Chaetomium sp. MPI-SDFR-AT-0129]
MGQTRMFLVCAGPVLARGQNKVNVWEWVAYQSLVPVFGCIVKLLGQFRVPIDSDTNSTNNPSSNGFATSESCVLGILINNYPRRTFQIMADHALQQGAYFMPATKRQPISWPTDRSARIPLTARRAQLWPRQEVVSDRRDDKC